MTTASIAGAVATSRHVIVLPHRTSGFFRRLGLLGSVATGIAAIRADVTTGSIPGLVPRPLRATFEPRLVLQYFKFGSI